MGGNSIRDRLESAGPIGKMIASRLDALIVAVNTLIAQTVTGQNPHKTNDTDDVVSVANADTTLDQVIDLAQQAIDNYETHIGSTSYHLAADTTNVVTEVGVAKEVYALLNEIKTDYEANRVNTSSHHGAADSTNAVTAANADTKAKSITLANDLRTQLNAHMATVDSVHGAADDTNPVTESALTAEATWTEIATMADALRTAYEAHRQLTAGSVHAGADSTNTVSAAAVGTIQTAANAGLNELKTDFNAHIAETGTSHALKDESMKVTAANASSLATSITLANALKAAINDHLTRADDVTAIPSLSLSE